MKNKMVFVLFISFVFVSCGLVFSAMKSSVADAATQDVTKAIIAREKAAFEAWQRQDRAFWENYLADDSTYFGFQNPYLETNPKENFLPKFEMYTNMFKMHDFQMYNPRVQVYGDVAILTYNSAVTAEIGGQAMNYTGKVTSVYAKQGGTWRVVHGHESINPGAK